MVNFWWYRHCTGTRTNTACKERVRREKMNEKETIYHAKIWTEIRGKGKYSPEIRGERVEMRENGPVTRPEDDEGYGRGYVKFH